MNLPGASRWIGVLMLALAVSAGGVGCEEEEPSGATEFKPRPRRNEKKDEKPKAAEGGEAAAGEDGEGEDERLAYSYNPIGKRDPFRSFIDKPASGDQTPPPDHPLQKYEIDQYKLVGIIWGVDNPTAMVEDPEGMGYFLSKETLIGRNWGKVVRITPSEVIVAEEYRDFEGKLIVNEIPLRLPAEKEK